MIDVRVQGADFDPGRQFARLQELGKAGISSLTMIAAADADVAEVVIEHYPAMAKEELARIGEEANSRWPLAGMILIHRYGRMAPGERLLVAAAAADRIGDAAEACAFLIEEIRRRAPFWRKDVLVGGETRWREIGAAEV